MSVESVALLSGFRRQLTVRLAIVGVLTSLLAGVAAYFIETERLDDTLVDQAALEARNLGTLIPEVAGPTDFTPLLRDFLAAHAATSRDFFVVAEIYDPGRVAISEATVPAYAYVEEKFDRKDHRFPPLGSTWYKKSFIDGAPFLQVMVPLAGGDGRAIGWFEGIYRLSPETVDGIRMDIAQITALVVGAVLLTAMVLHPLMTSLQGRVLGTAQDLVHANIATLKVLGSAIAKRDSDTNAHNFRVTIYAVRIAEAMGLDQAAIRRLIKGAFLHDVGKIAIADAILLKPGRLTAEEFTEMKTHVAHGLDIVSANAWLHDAMDVVGGHHEKVDGSGYPRGLAGGDIPLAARIFAVADVFDALTSERPYKTAMAVDTALAILEDGRGTHFDGTVLDAFNGIVARTHIEVMEEEDVEVVAEKMLRRYFTV